ncbi:response regulator [Nocardioides psychrotolerans]|uniref:response regulator n=1 Tax=Nocardioides psychrotolerans TaxID=1005945 RepID=UPI003137F742
MAQSSPESLLSQLAERCISPPDVATLLTRSLPLVLEVTGAGSAYVLRGLVEDVQVVAHAGATLATDALSSDLADEHSGWRELPVPSGWRDGGVSTAWARRLSGHPGPLVLVLTYDRDATRGDLLDVVGALLETAVRGAQSAADLADLTQRVDNAQHLANMGDYDWHIASDTNRWSDQLYRIYGHEPQSFNASYERFISHIHPDDRERIMAIHQQAYASGEPYQMIERVQRPTGETRYLSSNGQVLMDATGTPVRMRGTCIDITDLVLSEQEVERVSARFEALVESSGDAIMVLEGRLVVQSNDRSRALLGGDPVGQPLDRFVHVDADESLGVPGRRLDGQELTLDVFTSELNPGVDDDLVAVFVRDAAPRLASEALAVSLGEAQVRRRQAVEINDNIIQGLTASVYCLEESNVSAAAEYVQLTLSSARAMMNDLLEPLDGEDLQPGDLVRQSATTLRGRTGAAAGPDPTPVVVAPVTSDRRVLIVDDSEDMRMLVRLFLDRKEGVQVVGEAATGREGIRLAHELQPDLILLDLAMPEMDGLEALPQIFTGAPTAKVIVLSGFDHRLGDQALALGASLFVQKGGGLDELMRAIDKTLPNGVPPQRAAS